MTSARHLLWHTPSVSPSPNDARATTEVNRAKPAADAITGGSGRQRAGAGGVEQTLEILGVGRAGRETCVQCLGHER